jgi:hypothetical protein
MMVGEAWMHRIRSIPSPAFVKLCGTYAATVAVSPAIASKTSSPW